MLRIWLSVSLITWWRHQMETLPALLALCAGNSPVTNKFPSQRPVTRSFDVFFDLRLNKWLSKQSWGWWFETPSCSSWRHCNEICDILLVGTAPTVSWFVSLNDISYILHECMLWFYISNSLSGLPELPELNVHDDKITGELCPLSRGRLRKCPFITHL